MAKKNSRDSKKFNTSSLSPDLNTQELIQRILIRDKQGIKKFKTLMHQLDKSPVDFLEEAIEESIDKVRYLIEAKRRIEKKI